MELLPHNNCGHLLLLVWERANMHWHVTFPQHLGLQAWQSWLLLVCSCTSRGSSLPPITWAPAGTLSSWVGLNRALGLSSHSLEFAEDSWPLFWPYFSFPPTCSPATWNYLESPKCPYFWAFSVFFNLGMLPLCQPLSTWWCKNMARTHAHTTLPIALCTSKPKLKFSLWDSLWPTRAEFITPSCCPTLLHTYSVMLSVTSLCSDDFGYEGSVPEVKLLGYKLQLHHWAAWSWAGYLISPCLSFLICRMGMLLIITINVCWEN